MTAGPQAIEPDRDAIEAPRSSRPPWRWLVPVAVVVVVLIAVTLLFGGSTYGKLVMNDLNGRTYTVTSARLDGFAVGRQPPTITFRDGSVRWDAGWCNEATKQYRVVWSTLETSGPSISTAMGCDPTSEARDAAFAMFMMSQPEVRVQDENRVVMTGSSGSLDLLEQR